MHKYKKSFSPAVLKATTAEKGKRLVLVFQGLKSIRLVTCLYHLLQGTIFILIVIKSLDYFSYHLIFVLNWVRSQLRLSILVTATNMCKDYLREEAYLFKLDYFDMLGG